MAPPKNSGIQQDEESSTHIASSPSPFIEESTKEKDSCVKNEDNEDCTIGCGKRRLTSRVWNHFERVMKNGELKAVCQACKKEFMGKSTSGTSHLNEHLKRCMKVKKTLDVKQQLLQASSNKGGKSTLKVRKSDFNPQVARKELANMIVLHEYPLAIVEHIGFKRYSRSLNPDFYIVSRNTIKADILKDFKEERDHLKKLFAANSSKVAITTDMWTSSNQRKGYMAVTAHFIDDDWVLQNHLIRFMYVPCPHNKDRISKALIECLKSFNLDEKVSTITVDNCTTNDAVMDVLREKLTPSKLILHGSYLHMRCCAHILNLIVNDGLNIISGAIEKIRCVVVFCTSTPKRYEKFEDACNYVKIPLTKKLALDCKTRWNSCYDMLQVAIMYKDAFTRLDIKIGKRGKEKFVLPTKDEWQMASDICDKLAIFKRATESFSGINYPTANLYFQKVCEIKLALRKWLTCGNKVIELMASSMIVKFDKYWEAINVILSVASVLDPRRKLECVSLYFRILYSDDGEFECDKVRKVLVELVDDYGKKVVDEESSLVFPSSFANDQGKRTLIDSEDVEGLWEKHVLQQPLKRARKCEVETYLEDQRIVVDDSKFNLLAWWSVESSKFLILSKIARDLLAVPISTVASESAFSKGGRVVGPHRSRLHPDTLEALMCLQSWRLPQFKDATNDGNLQCAPIYEDEDVELGDGSIE